MLLSLFLVSPTVVTSITTSSLAPSTIVSSTYSSAWTTNSQKFARISGGVANYYYEAIRVIVNTSGNYNITSSSNIDTYGYLYASSFYPSNISLNLIPQDDGSGGNLQFKFTRFVDSSVVYILVATTYSGGVMAPFSIIVSGPSIWLSGASTGTTVGGANGQIGFPTDVSVDNYGTIYALSGGGLYRFYPGSTWGTIVISFYATTFGFKFDSVGNAYIADYGSNVISKYTVNGTSCGTGMASVRAASSKLASMAVPNLQEILEAVKGKARLKSLDLTTSH
ncbi:unnamed protein product [Rotaria magnacalcarata]|uniref:Uncharacterized protein n=1 Tax=Rotaria magnacalcarata TaxID=392030 RepID=A0A816CNR5_9BILA|nr:unnamed protein product [Rotaria magnacalcarata]